MLYCVWNIQFGVIRCFWNIQFGFYMLNCIGTYSLVLYVVVYSEHSLVLHTVLYLEHTVWFYMLYCIWNISSYKCVCTYCIAFEPSLHITARCLNAALYFRCLFTKNVVFILYYIWDVYSHKNMVFICCILTSLQIKESTSKLQKL
jgi:hypothetical protein